MSSLRMFGFSSPWATNPQGGPLADWALPTGGVQWPQDCEKDILEKGILGPAHQARE